MMMEYWISHTAHWTHTSVCHRAWWGCPAHSAGRRFSRMIISRPARRGSAQALPVLPELRSGACRPGERTLQAGRQRLRGGELCEGPQAQQQQKEYEQVVKNSNALHRPQGFLKHHGQHLRTMHVATAKIGCYDLLTGKSTTHQVAIFAFVLLVTTRLGTLALVRRPDQVRRIDVQHMTHSPETSHAVESEPEECVRVA